MDSIFTRQQIHEFQNIFSLFDKDGDGTVSVNELQLVLRSLGQNPSPEEVRRMMVEIDTDGSGEIDFGEFMDMITQRLTENVMEQGLLESFQEFDKAGTGNVSADKLREILSTFGDPLTKKEIDEMIELGDNHGEGFINYRRLVKILISHHH